MTDTIDDILSDLTDLTLTAANGGVIKAALIRAKAPGREEIARELEARRDLQADAQWLRDRLALIRRICERNGPSHLKVAEIRNLLKDPS